MNSTEIADQLAQALHPGEESRKVRSMPGAVTVVHEGIEDTTQLIRSILDACSELQGRLLNEHHTPSGDCSVGVFLVSESAAITISYCADSRRLLITVLSGS